MKLPLWICADGLDPPYPGSDFTPEIYNLDAVAYESLMLGVTPQIDSGVLAT